MLVRTPEPELMDTTAQAEAYAAANFDASHQLQVDALVEQVGSWLPAAPRVLDLCCGPADITVRIARALPDAQILAVDGADAMLVEARARVDREGLTDRIELRQVRLPDPTLGSSRDGAGYDLVVSTSALHHLADPGALWTTIRDTVGPGGGAFVSDLRRPERAEDVDALVARYSDGEPQVLVDDFRQSLHAAYRVDEIGAQLRDTRLPLMIQALGDRHLVAWGRIRTPDGGRIRITATDSER